jgi:hypothetical protein
MPAETCCLIAALGAVLEEVLRLNRHDVGSADPHDLLFRRIVAWLMISSMIAAAGLIS